MSPKYNLPEGYEQYIPKNELDTRELSEHLKEVFTGKDEED